MDVLDLFETIIEICPIINIKIKSGFEYIKTKGFITVKESNKVENRLSKNSSVIKLVPSTMPKRCLRGC